MIVEIYESVNFPIIHFSQIISRDIFFAKY